MEAIQKAGACLGIVFKDGIIMVGEKNIQSKLWIPERSEKFAKIDSHIVLSVIYFLRYKYDHSKVSTLSIKKKQITLKVAIAGVTSDANILVDNAQLNAARYKYKYQESIPVEMCVHDTCNYTQSFTQFGGLRPFGVSMLWAGYDTEEGFQLFHSDPSGNYGMFKQIHFFICVYIIYIICVIYVYVCMYVYIFLINIRPNIILAINNLMIAFFFVCLIILLDTAEWQATAIGSNAKSAQSILKEDYNEKLTKDDAIELCIKILTKTMDSPSLDSEKCYVFFFKPLKKNLLNNFYKI
ncbi:20S proteasome subunit PAC1 [Reticulomyxa filosa]|uniref:20S proteasome subunit PAC1 n=1 Tax=Reticulomyxa filosa TaxID=46433 RepID=X6P159_RETFI|nr:20S proteasome subunit PAC1 [Reticulomyxa filosa]|eukprot:ETO31282.1 20S proteasome subunit PAC1 [Reticulomyxa filosa]